ncbi:MAG TPA: patatin-like phospholipase family protein [Terriglobales bacterium]|nr:patatin-like phospholipase family protein [Terriglobales bacterium]
MPFPFQRRAVASERSRRTWVLSGGGARGAAQVGVLQALFECGLEPPRRLIGVSVGALNAATMAAYPSRAGAAMLRELWFSRLAQDVFRLHPLGVVLSRLRGDTLSAMPATNVTRLIERAIQLIGIETFEGLRVPLEVLATDIGAGRPHVFRDGRLLPALRASTAIPGVFPAVRIEEAGYLDGGIVDNCPLGLALAQGEHEVLGIELMAGEVMERPPANWAELMARTVQLMLHQRMLSDFARLRRLGRVAVLCPVLSQGDGLDMEPRHVEGLIERTRQATIRLLQERGRRLFRESGVHYIRLAPAIGD